MNEQIVGYLLAQLVSLLGAILRLAHRAVGHVLHREPHFGHLAEASGRRSPYPLAVAAGLVYLIALDRTTGVLSALGAAYLWHLARGKASLYRWELGALIAAGVVLLVLGTFLPGLGALAVLLGGVGLAYATRREEMEDALRLRGVRRRFVHATAHLALAGPIVADAIWRVPAGYRIRVRIGRGATAEHLDLGAVAAHLDLHAVRIAADHHARGHATVELIERDALADAAPIPWPGAGSTWDPVQVGISESGEPVTLGLVGHNCLVGGEPGAGKSNFLQLLLASAVADPAARVWLLDRKALELGPWSAHAERFAVTTDDAIALLRALAAEMDALQADLLARNARKVERETGLPLNVLFVDELASYTDETDTKKRARFNGLLEDVVRRGRALGVILVAAVQHPHSSTVPTGLRDLISYRIGFRCATSDASDLVLGRGFAGEGYDASRIRPEDRGVGWLRAEGDRPRRLKAYWLTDEQLARRAGSPPPGASGAPAGQANGAGQVAPAAAASNGRPA